MSFLSLRKRSDRAARHGGKSATTHRCGRCRAVARKDTPRCAHCGNRLVSGAPSRPATDSVGPIQHARIPKPSHPELTPIQREILQAAQYGRVGDHTIHVLGTSIAGEGEVKSGGRRFYGNGAVEALAALTVPGLIEAAGEDHFELTEAGARSAVEYEMRQRFGTAPSDA